jgi:hypothetical protein
VSQNDHEEGRVIVTVDSHFMTLTLMERVEMMICLLTILIEE